MPRSGVRIPRCVQPHLLEHALDDVRLLLPRRMRRIDDVQQEVRRARLLERRPEGRYEVVRQLPNEPYGVGEAEPVAATQIHLAGERVERREQTVLDEDVVAG